MDSEVCRRQLTPISVLCFVKLVAWALLRVRKSAQTISRATREQKQEAHHPTSSLTFAADAQSQHGALERPQKQLTSVRWVAREARVSTSKMGQQESKAHIVRTLPSRTRWERTPLRRGGSSLRGAGLGKRFGCNVWFATTRVCSGAVRNVAPVGNVGRHGAGRKSSETTKRKREFARWN